MIWFIFTLISLPLSVLSLHFREVDWIEACVNQIRKLDCFQLNLSSDYLDIDQLQFLLSFYIVFAMLNCFVVFSVNLLKESVGNYEFLNVWSLCGIHEFVSMQQMEGTVFTPALEGIQHVKSEAGEILTKPFLEACKHILPVIGATPWSILSFKNLSIVSSLSDRYDFILS